MRPQPGQATTRGQKGEGEALQDLLGNADFLAAVAARFRRQRDADRVANAFLKEDGDRRVEETSPWRPCPPR